MQKQSRIHTSKRNAWVISFAVGAAVVFAGWAAWLLTAPDSSARYEQWTITDIAAPSKPDPDALNDELEPVHRADQPGAVLPNAAVDSPRFKLMGILMREETEKRTAIIAVESTPAGSFGVEEKVGDTDVVVHTIEKDLVLLKHPDDRIERLLLASSEGDVPPPAGPVLTKSGEPVNKDLLRIMREWREEGAL